MSISININIELRIKKYLSLTRVSRLYLQIS
jgi:hypothetical protein